MNVRQSDSSSFGNNGFSRASPHTSTQLNEIFEDCICILYHSSNITRDNIGQAVVQVQLFPVLVNESKRC